MLEVFERLFSKVAAKSNTLPHYNSGAETAAQSVNIIDELFDGDVYRKRDVTYATMTSNACLHEAGHLMMAELNNIAIEYVYLPQYGDFFEQRGGNPGVQPAVQIQGLPQKIAFYLGGIFGELNIYDNVALRDPRAVSAFTQGCRGDIITIIQYIREEQQPGKRMQDLASHLGAALKSSNEAKDTVSFLQALDVNSLPQFSEFRSQRLRHRAIAHELYERWRALNFAEFKWPRPTFVS